MGKFFAGLVIGMLVMLAGMCVNQGWIPSGADSAFLVMGGICVLTGLFWFLLGHLIDNTNGNDSGIIAMFIVAVVAVVATLTAPVAVLLGLTWAASVYIGCGIMLAGVILGSWTIASG